MSTDDITLSEINTLREMIDSSTSCCIWNAAIFFPEIIAALEVKYFSDSRPYYKKDCTCDEYCSLEN